MLEVNRLGLWIGLVAATPLAAQGNEPTDPHLRNDCRLAAQVVRTGHPAPQSEWAYSLISECAQSGSSAVASRWGARDLDTLTLQRLLRATARLRTRETYEAVRGAARDPRSTRLVRIYALSMLYSFAHPGRSVRVSDLLHPRGWGPRVYRVSGDGGVANAPDLGNVRQEVETVLGEIITGGGDADVVRAATMLRDWL